MVGSLHSCYITMLLFIYFVSARVEVWKDVLSNLVHYKPRRLILVFLAIFNS